MHKENAKQPDYKKQNDGVGNENTGVLKDGEGEGGRGSGVSSGERSLSSHI